MSTCHCETTTLRRSPKDEREQLPVHRAGPALPAASSARPAPRPAPQAAEASASPGRTGAPCSTRRAALPEEPEPPATVSADAAAAAAATATATAELRGVPSLSRVSSEPPAVLPAPPAPLRLPLGLRPQLPARTRLHSGAARAAAAGAAAAHRGALQVVPGEAAAVPGQDVFQAHVHPAARRGGGEAARGVGWRGSAARAAGRGGGCGEACALLPTASSALPPGTGRLPGPPGR